MQISAQQLEECHLPEGVVEYEDVDDLLRDLVNDVNGYLDDYADATDVNGYLDDYVDATDVNDLWTLANHAPSPPGDFGGGEKSLRNASPLMIPSGTLQTAPQLFTPRQPTTTLPASMTPPINTDPLASTATTASPTPDHTIADGKWMRDTGVNPDSGWIKCREERATKKRTGKTRLPAAPYSRTKTQRRPARQLTRFKTTELEVAHILADENHETVSQFVKLWKMRHGQNWVHKLLVMGMAVEVGYHAPSGVKRGHTTCQGNMWYLKNSRYGVNPVNGAPHGHNFPYALERGSSRGKDSDPHMLRMAPEFFVSSPGDTDNIQ